MELIYSLIRGKMNWCGQSCVLVCVFFLEWQKVEGKHVRMCVCECECMCVNVSRMCLHAHMGVWDPAPQVQPCEVPHSFDAGVENQSARRSTLVQWNTECMQYRAADKHLHTHVLLYCILVYSCSCLKGLATVQKCDPMTHQFIHEYFCSHVCRLFFFIHFSVNVLLFFSSCDQSANKLWGRVLSTHLCPNNILILLISFGVDVCLTWVTKHLTRLFEVARKGFAGSYIWYLFKEVKPFGLISHGPSLLNTVVSQQQNCFVFETIWPLRSMAAESFIFCIEFCLRVSLFVCD